MLVFHRYEMNLQDYRKLIEKRLLNNLRFR